MRRWTVLTGVLLAFGLLLAACGDDSGDDGGDGGAAAEDEGGGGCDSDVCISDSLFEPADVTIAAGESVSWQNQDGFAHTVTADDGAFDSGELAEGDTHEETLDEAGEFTYHCEIHPSMTGTVTVE
jgi:plastocyanin